ncbi:hypothetical protein GGI00_004853, partial [Coemansia sp. RSA 2681]
PKESTDSGYTLVIKSQINESNRAHFIEVLKDRVASLYPGIDANTLDAAFEAEDSTTINDSHYGYQFRIIHMDGGLRAMDDILQTVKLEVTLDCMQGSSLSQVWSYVELAQRRLLQRNGMDPEPVSIDVLMKRYLWPYIVKLPEMTFINEGTVIYNSTATIAQSTTSGFLLLSADEVESQYPDLTVHASPRLIYKELFGREEGNEKLLRSTQAFTLIQALSRSREKGITQVQLSKSFGLDPRSTFHFLRVIDREGLLTKTVTYDHGITTNLWVLRRFATDGQDATDSAAVRGNAPVPNPSDNNDALTVYLVSNELRKRVVDVLETTETGYMLETDLMD